jgi:transcription elongation factor/antiterminator RfaH
MESAVACVNKELALRANERWYVVHTLPRSEGRASLHLKAQGFRTHYPTIHKTTRHARKLRTVNAPLFPRYLFIILDPSRGRWLSIRSTVGVSSLVSCNGMPVPVPAGVVETLIEHGPEANLALFGNTLRKGQQVRILTGPFADFIGTLERLDDNGRVRVLLELMGTEVPVAISRSRLLPAA